MPGEPTKLIDLMQLEWWTVERMIWAAIVCAIGLYGFAFLLTAIRELWNGR